MTLLGTGVVNVTDYCRNAGPSHRSVRFPHLRRQRPHHHLRRRILRHILRRPKR
jgi:hypothetical protein